MTTDYLLKIVVRSDLSQRAIEHLMTAALKDLEEKGFLVPEKNWRSVSSGIDLQPKENLEE